MLREGSIQDSPPLQWLVMLVVQGVLAPHVLVESPQSISRDQRELWLKDKLQLMRVGEIVRENNDKAWELESGSWMEHFGRDFTETWQHDSRWRFVRPYRKFEETGLAGAALDYLHWLEYLSLDYGEEAKAARHRFDRRLNPPAPENKADNLQQPATDQPEQPPSARARWDVIP